jgi:methylated-DNA-[protein]-cysteine S-methyltransferase
MMIEYDRVLADLAEIEPPTLTRLHQRLEQRAEQLDLLDVAFRTVDSPVGPLLIAATPRGLVRVAYEREGMGAVLQSLASTVSPRVLAAPRRLDDAASQLEEYFAGRRRVFDVPLDLRLAAGFRRLVLAELTGIPYGSTRSYTEVAAATGHPRAVRAVGSACASNPLPLVVPCHRVLRSDGSVGGYLGGSEIKRALLELEAAAGSQ